MSISEVIFHLILQLNWKNILLLNANNEGSLLLLRLLNDAGTPVILVGQDDIKSFPWPGRLSLEAPIEGFILMVGSEENLTKIIYSLQDKEILTPRRKWIMGVDRNLCLKQILPTFDEADQVLIVGNKVYQEEKPEKAANSDDLNRDVNMWSLRSSGDGGVHFERSSFRNFNSVNELFDAPFTNFFGRSLTISSLGSPPIRIPPKTPGGRWNGYIFRIINTLADVYNFTYVVKEAENRFYGMAQEDGTWNGMIGELTRKSVDMGVGDISFTLDRYMAVDLTHPIFPETVTFIYRAPEFYSRTWILFEGINPKVWIAMTSASLAAFTAYFLSLSLHKIWRGSVKDTSTVYIRTADESVSSLYRALLGKGVLHVPHSISSRAVMGTWFISSLILSALYGGSLTSKLSLHKSPKPADSLKELLKRHPNAMLALRNNSQIHQFFKESEFWNDVWTKNMEKHVIPGRFSIKDAMVRVHSQNSSTPYIWIAERSMLVKMMYRYSDDPVVCDLYVAKESIVRSDWSLALQRDSPFLEQFDMMIARMHRFGLLERWSRIFWESASGSCHPSDGLNQSSEKPISLGDARAIFFVLGIGWVVGIILLLAERQYYAKVNHYRY